MCEETIFISREDNFKGYLNDAIHILGELQKDQIQDVSLYRNIILFSAAAVEIGSKITLNKLNNSKGNVFKKNMKWIGSEIEKKSPIIIKNKFEGLFEHKKEIDFSYDDFKGLVVGMFKLRNDLIHECGEFNKDVVIKNILEMLCRLQYILPDELNYKQSLRNENFIILKNEKDYMIIDDKILKEFEFVVLDKGTYSTDYFFDCPECVSQMRRTFSGSDNSLLFICPMCLTWIDCFVCERCGSLENKEDEIELDSHIFLCSNCHSHEFSP